MVLFCPPTRYRFARLSPSSLFGLDKTFALPNAQFSENEKLKLLIVVACRLFSQYLIIHPYVNGNGHIARVLLTWIMARYGYWMIEFPIEPRPSEPEYSQLIFRYQNGQPEPLEQMVLRAILIT